MSVRPCLQWPDKRLYTAAAPVEVITDELRAQIMRAASRQAKRKAKANG